MHALTAKDKLSLEGLAIVLSIVVTFSGAVAWMENRYPTNGDLRGLRCDVYLIQLTSIRDSDSRTPMQDSMARRLENRWEQLCTGSSGGKI